MIFKLGKVNGREANEVGEDSTGTEKFTGIEHNPNIESTKYKTIKPH
jgi:hypothetical protein